MSTFKTGKKSPTQRSTIPEQLLEIAESKILEAQDELSNNGNTPEPMLLAKILSQATLKH